MHQKRVILMQKMQKFSHPTALGASILTPPPHSEILPTLLIGSTGTTQPGTGSVCELSITTDRYYTVCRSLSSMPRARSIFKAYNVWAHELIGLLLARALRLTDC